MITTAIRRRARRLFVLCVVCFVPALWLVFISAGGSVADVAGLTRPFGLLPVAMQILGMALMTLYWVTAYRPQLSMATSLPWWYVSFVYNVVLCIFCGGVSLVAPIVAMILGPMACVTGWVGYTSWTIVRDLRAPSDIVDIHDPQHRFPTFTD